MDMQNNIEGRPFTEGALSCAHDLVTAALQIVDDLELPGDIGAHLDHAVNMMRKVGGVELLRFDQVSM